MSSSISPSRRAWQRFRRNRLGFTSLVAFVVLVLLSWLQPGSRWKTALMQLCRQQSSGWWRPGQPLQLYGRRQNS